MTGELLLWIAAAVGIPLIVFVAIFLYNLWLTVGLREACKASLVSAWRVMKEILWWAP